MAEAVVLRHRETGDLKTTLIGWSWTTLLFGFFVPIVRGDFKWAVLMIILHVLAPCLRGSS